MMKTIFSVFNLDKEWLEKEKKEELELKDELDYFIIKFGEEDEKNKLISNLEKEKLFYEKVKNKLTKKCHELSKNYEQSNLAKSYHKTLEKFYIKFKNIE